jgi:hypothetical protein
MRKISSFALAFAFMMPLAGCPGDDGGTTDTVAETGMTSTPMTGSATETPMTDTGAETDAPATGTGADSGTAGGGAGFCGLTCEAPEDCAMGGNAADWECNEGFCEYVGVIPDPPACDDTTCPAAIGGACADVNGINICTFPCTDGGTECDALMLTCTGADDAGNSICAAPPCGGVAEGEPCESAAGQSGVCTDGVCACSDDAECTVMGYACNN